MQLEKPESGDLMEDYFLGTSPTGGYWRILERLDSHDHTGGLLGKPITAATIPDGSITTSKLDPSVLAPYALTDGSKPFSGQVTMQADAVIRDELLFGEQGTALAPDVHLRRTGVGALRLDTNLGVGVTPAAWGGGYVAAQVGASGAVWAAGSAQTDMVLSSNTMFDGTSRRAIITGAGVEVVLAAGAIDVRTMASVSAGAVQTRVTRASLAPTGTLTLTPDAGAVALSTGQWSLRTAAQVLTLAREGSGDMLVMDAIATGTNVRTHWSPITDNTYYAGLGASRWVAVYAVNGTIQTSAAESKTDITPLDPAAALAAVLATDPVVFDYRPPERPAEWYDLPDDPEQAEAVLHQRLTSAPLEAAARHQAGFVLSSPDYATDPLFETGKGQSNAANTAGVLLAAVKALATRVTALEES